MPAIIGANKATVLSGSVSVVAAAPFSPAAYPNLVADWDASALTLANNDPISSFTDLSGAGRHSVASGTLRPLCKTNGLNGMRTVLYDGVNDVTEAAIALADVSGAGTRAVFIVMRLVAIPPNGTRLLCIRPQAVASVLYDSGAGGRIMYHGDSGESLVGPFGGVITDWHVYGIRGSSPTVCKLYRDGGSPIVTFNPRVHIYNGFKPCIGGPDNSGGNVASIEVAHQTIHDANFTDEQWDSYFTGIGGKWDLPVT